MGGKYHYEIKNVSNTHGPQLMVPFNSILFETSICQFNSSKCSTIMPDEVREHLTRDYSFIQNLSRPFRFRDPWRCVFSSVHLTHFLQGSVQRNGMAIAEDWFCAQWLIFVLFLRFVFELLYGWKIKTWPIRFLTESVTFFTVTDLTTSNHSQSHFKLSSCLITEYAGVCFLMS